MIFGNEINKILDALKRDPALTDIAEYVDLIKEPILESPNDLHHVAFYVTRVRGVDSQITSVSPNSSQVIARGQFKVIGICRDCNKESLLRWLMFTLQYQCGINAAIIQFSDDSETIYQQETGAPLQWELKIVRITFEIKAFLNLADCDPDLCNIIECDPVKN